MKRVVKWVRSAYAVPIKRYRNKRNALESPPSMCGVCVCVYVCICVYMYVYVGKVGGARWQASESFVGQSRYYKPTPRPPGGQTRKARRD